MYPWERWVLSLLWRCPGDGIKITMKTTHIVTEWRNHKAYNPWSITFQPSGSTALGAGSVSEADTDALCTNYGERCKGAGQASPRGQRLPPMQKLGSWEPRNQRRKGTIVPRFEAVRSIVLSCLTNYGLLWLTHPSYVGFYTIIFDSNIWPLPTCTKCDVSTTGELWMRIAEKKLCLQRQADWLTCQSLCRVWNVVGYLSWAILSLLNNRSLQPSPTSHPVSDLTSWLQIEQFNMCWL